MKRVLSVLLSALLLAGLVLPFTAFAENEIPDGYTPIYTVEDLDNVRNNPSGKYILMNDLDLAGINWVPLPLSGVYEGVYKEPVFDGNGHVILNLTVACEDYGGLFGSVGGAVIQNLGIVNCSIEVTGKTGAGGDIAAAGGIVGYASSGVVIRNCFVFGTVHSSANSPYGTKGVGGIVGITGIFFMIIDPPVPSFSPVLIQDCYSAAQVSSAVSSNVGGIVGRTYSYVSCDMSTSYFSGSSTNSPICSNLNQLRTIDFYSLDTSAPAGYELPPPPSTATALTDAQMRQQGSFAGFDFSESGPWVMPAGGGYPVLKVFTRKVTYDANGGSGAPDAQVKAWGETLTLRAARPTKAGYTFQGWAKSAGAAAAEFQPGGSYAAHENATLYAVWKANAQPAKPTIFSTRYEQTPWNWFRFIVLFGWVWMWF